MNDSKNILHHIQPEKIVVPSEDYFDQLAKGIITGQKATMEQKARVIPFYRRKAVMWWSAAAAVVLVFLLTFIPSSFNREESVTAKLDALPKSEIRDYIVENIDDFELDELTEIVEPSTVDAFRASPVTLEKQSDDSLFDALSAAEIEAYFEQEGIDEEELEEELFI